MGKMLLHELHAAVIHVPLTLLPTAVVADLIAANSGDRAWARVGRRLWVAGTVSSAISGIAGLAASQEVKLDEPRVRDMTFLHGAGNFVALIGALGVTIWRQRRRPTVAEAMLGLLTCGLMLYTASLGGKMVYEHGVGINAMPDEATRGTRRGPPLFSREAPAALVRDAIQGMGWMRRRARWLFTGEQPLAPGAGGLEPSKTLPSVPRRDLRERGTAPRV